MPESETVEVARQSGALEISALEIHYVVFGFWPPVDEGGYMRISDNPNTKMPLTEVFSSIGIGISRCCICEAGRRGAGMRYEVEDTRSETSCLNFQPDVVGMTAMTVQIRRPGACSRY